MYVVTGAAGLIGSGTVWGLNQSGIDNILAVDHLGTSDKWKNLRALKFADYLEKDKFRQKLLSGDFDSCNIEAIIHLGACSATTERDASYLIDNNFSYSRDLAEFAIRNRIRFLYASSCATYGDGSMGYVDDESNLEQLRPLNMYGYSKHLFDLWSKRQGILSKITGLKFSNVYGPNEQHKGEMRSVVSRAYEQISAVGKLRLFKSYRQEYSNGEQLRDFLYLKDAVDMILFLMKSDKGYGIFNIGSGKAESWNALAAAAFSALDKPVQIEYIEMPEHLRDRYQYYTRADMTKLKSIGYDRKPTTLSAAISDYIRNYRIPDKFLGD